MAYVIAEPCVATCETACVEVCPVDCIHGPLSVSELRSVAADRPTRLAGVQLYIDPDECTSCGACATECSVHAIHDEDDLPERWRHYVELNAAFFAERRR